MVMLQAKNLVLIHKIIPSTKFLQLLLCVLQEKFIKLYVFIILEVTAVDVSHYNFKEK